MGLTPVMLMLLALLAPQMIEEPVVIIEDCAFEESYECGDVTDIYEEPVLTDVTFEMYETFSFDAFEYTITDAYFAESTELIDEYSLDYFGEPENLLVIDFEYTNISERADSPRYYLSFYGDNFIVEEYAHLHSMSEVNPGRSGRGQLVYDVPDGVQLLELEISTWDYYDQSTAIIEIVVDEE